MGAVYRAEDTLLSGRICAIKEISLDPDNPEELLTQLQEQFRQEASVLARLDHPSLPKVSDYFTHDGREYLVMDYVPGHNLREVIEEALAEDRFLAESDVLDWAQQLSPQPGSSGAASRHQAIQHQTDAIGPDQAGGFRTGEAADY